ncbi:DUF3037 domain-containing protein [Marinobacter flavimaris]|uniref:DUF3037 domain-containing protein n=2 Tax=Marinobacter TaxID=2742 RepID=A0A3D8H350_9GAMM|nr:DUF3037 domain-containing protein [Marinobacter sp.]MBL3825924.1 DUF3037 domain-containing protein [Marinobacter sp. MC3]MBL3894501.1 DUF3037 domain-containing protein [Marinobacter sp. MW3]MCP4065123.1 DUF3037 domain-containing protein [Gammaproteobacteria bacterium]PPI80711.1 DUF3037 domain-containing protein [Marinobacter flavimaris]HAP51528.1 DUF3037 domain-containing protein [Marinobacter adhaerens]
MRFMPYIETGEFANVGILLWAPKTRYLGFKLLRKKHARITQFFEELDRGLYLKTMANLDAELRRVQGMLKDQVGEFGDNDRDYGFHKGLFQELIRPRETIVRFSEQRAVLAENPEQTLAELYEYYVGRNFVTREYQETILEKGIKQLLEQRDLAKRFTKRRIEDQLYGVTFPFVEQKDNEAIRVIKPLFLGQTDSTAIIEHGGKWKLKVDQLRKRHLLKGPVLFPVKGPEPGQVNDLRVEAFEETLANLEGDGIEITLHTEKDRILEFAGMHAH